MHVGNDDIFTMLNIMADKIHCQYMTDLLSVKPLYKYNRKYAQVITVTAM